MTTNENSGDESFTPAYCKTDVSGSRLLGKTNAMILSMIPELQSGGKVGVAGCKDLEDITERLKSLGIEVKSEPMFTIQRLKAVHNVNSIEGEIIGFEGGDKVQTGFLFYCH